MSPRPKKTPTAPAPQAKVFRRKRAAPQPTPRDASAPDYSHTPLDAIPLTGLPPRALIAPNFRMYELTKSDLAARLGIDNGFTSEAHLRAAIHLARQVLQPIRDAFGSFSPNSVYRSQKLERALKNKPASWLSTSQHAKGEACDIEIVANRRWSWLHGRATTWRNSTRSSASATTRPRGRTPAGCTFRSSRRVPAPTASSA